MWLCSHGHYIASQRLGVDLPVKHLEAPSDDPYHSRAPLGCDPERVADVYERLLPNVGAAHAKQLWLLAGDRLPTREELIEGIGGHRVVITLTGR